MKPLNAIHQSTPGRKKQILDAALRHFAQRGVEATAVEDIGHDAGVAVSSIYHHFGGKDRLAAAVYCEGIGRFQDGYAAALEAQMDAHAGILAIVRYHLDWVVANPDWARYLFDTRRKQFDAEQEQALSVLNRKFHVRLGQWFRPRIENGELRDLPFDAYVALLVGPCQELARAYLGGRLASDMETIKQATAQAVWRAVAGAPD
jgi:AcrR family transcriptional regulator